MKLLISLAKQGVIPARLIRSEMAQDGAARGGRAC